MPKQQPINAFSNLFNGMWVRHGVRIVGFTQGSQSKIKIVGARGVVHTPQFNGKQEGRVAQRGSRLHLRCPRNGQWTNLSIPLSSICHWVP